jgi:type II secretory pathway component PulF
MALFKFKVSDQTGTVSTLLIEGDSQTDATRRLQRRNLIPLEFLGEGGQTVAKGWLPGKGPRFDIVDFTDRLVPLLEAEIPLERALGILGEGETNPLISQLVTDLRRGLHEGRKLSQLIRDRGTLFPRLYANVVEAGEEAGALPQVMSELRRFLNQGREFRSFMISSSIYPVIVLAVSFVVIGVLLGLIVPKFADILQGAGQQISLPTAILLQTSALVQHWWWVPPAALVAIIFIGMQARNDGRLRDALENTLLKLPVAGKIILLSNLARLCRTMSILMKSGVHLLDTVSISLRILQTQRLRLSLASLETELRQGQRLSQALSHSSYIPHFVLRMVAVGEETGAVEAMLERVAERYEKELRQLFSRIMGLIEPAIIVCLGLFVASIVLMMFLAIMDIQGGF